VFDTSLYIYTIVQQLDTKVYNHIISLLQVSAFFGQLKGGIRQRKTKLAKYVTDVQL